MDRQKFRDRVSSGLSPGTAMEMIIEHNGRGEEEASRCPNCGATGPDDRLEGCVVCDWAEGEALVPFIVPRRNHAETQGDRPS
jgi:hypothetical protein